MTPDTNNKFEFFLKPYATEDKKERRTWPRHLTAIPVSLRCEKDADNKASWHIGEALNVSVDGLSVKVDPLPGTRVSSLVKLFCLPGKDALPPGILDPEPVWITGEVIWKDKAENTLGVKILT